MMRRCTMGFVAILMLTLQPASVFAADTGATSPGTAVSDSSEGGTVWTNPGDADGTDGTNATVGTFNVDTELLKATNFGFSIPTGASIDGIELTVYKNFLGIATDDKTVKLVKGGSLVGDNKQTDTNWPTSLNDPVLYGGSTDLWGTTWAESEVNASTFGVAMSANASCIGLCFPASTVQVEQIYLTVYYTEAPSGGGAARQARKRIQQMRSAQQVSFDTEEPTLEAVGIFTPTEVPTVIKPLRSALDIRKELWAKRDSTLNLRRPKHAAPPVASAPTVIVQPPTQHRVCARIAKRFAEESNTYDRVATRVFRRMGIRCEG
jgi:hypothetical protein